MAGGIGVGIIYRQCLAYPVSFRVCGAAQRHISSYAHFVAITAQAIGCWRVGGTLVRFTVSGCLGLFNCAPTVVGHETELVLLNMRSAWWVYHRFRVYTRT